MKEKNELFKTWNYLVSERKGKQIFQVRTMSKDAEAVVQGCSVKKVVLRNFANFREILWKRPVRESLF